MADDVPPVKRFTRRAAIAIADTRQSDRRKREHARRDDGVPDIRRTSQPSRRRSILVRVLDIGHAGARIAVQPSDDLRPASDSLRPF